MDNEVTGQVRSMKTEIFYPCGGIGEYVINQDYTINSDHAIANWMNNYDVCNVSTAERELEDSNISDYMHGPDPHVKLKWTQRTEPLHKEIDVGNGSVQQTFQIYNGIERAELDR